MGNRLDSHPRCFNCRKSVAEPCDKDHRCQHCYNWNDDLFEKTLTKRSYASKRSSSLVSPSLFKKPFNIYDDKIVRDHLAEKAESSDESSIFSDREGSEAEDAEDSEFHETVDTNVILPNNDNKYVVITKVRSIEKSSESSTGSVSGSNAKPPDSGHRTSQMAQTGQCPVQTKSHRTPNTRQMVKTGQQSQIVSTGQCPVGRPDTGQSQTQTMQTGQGPVHAQSYRTPDTGHQSQMVQTGQGPVHA